MASYDTPVVFYESPHRILKTLEALTRDSMVNHTIVVARELTKLHEEVVKGSATGVLEYFVEHPDHVRGEFVVIVTV